MTPDPVWKPLSAELDRWASEGRVADFWLRDDDAVAPTDALDRLLALAQASQVPVTLAVIPASTGEALASRLEGMRQVTVVAHGWSHENYAPPGEKKQELGGHRPLQTVVADLTRGFERLSGLHARRFAPVLVPPWNRIDASLIPELARIGFESLSVFGPPKPAPLQIVNSTVDIMDWRGGRGSRSHEELVGEIIDQMQRAFAAGGEPVGVLTHHLIHDEGAWAFLQRLFRVTARRGCRWRSIGQLIGPGGMRGVSAA